MAIELHLHSKLPCSYSIAIHMQVIHIRIDLIFLRLTERVRISVRIISGLIVPCFLHDLLSDFIRISFGRL
jgi:TRAP-type mannitol/chloroaromatic compound transport system permease small subunit